MIRTSLETRQYLTCKQYRVYPSDLQKSSSIYAQSAATEFTDILSLFFISRTGRKTMATSRRDCKRVYTGNNEFNS